MTKSSLALCLMLFTLSTPALAADNGAYLVGSVGQTKFKDVDFNSLSPSIVFADLSLDDTGSGFKLGGGYAFNRNVAVEGAYVDLGKAAATGTHTGSIKYSGESKASGPVVTLVGLVPVGEQLSLLGRIGFIMGTVETTDSAGRGGTARELKPTFGIGLAYSFIPQFAVRADFDRYQKLGDAIQTGESNVDMISMGLVYKFR